MDNHVYLETTSTLVGWAHICRQQSTRLYIKTGKTPRVRQEVEKREVLGFAFLWFSLTVTGYHVRSRVSLLARREESVTSGLIIGHLVHIWVTG